MDRRSSWTWVVLILGAALVASARAEAGGLGKPRANDCPPPSYSPWHYWTPGLYRIFQCRHGPHIDLHAPDRHPAIAPTYSITPFPCPPVDPVSYSEVRTVSRP